MPVPLVSIIIPVYRHERMLIRTLRSIYSQTYPNLEVVVVDDGNGDPVVVEEERLSAHPQLAFQCIRQKHRGAPAARNTGFAASHGEYVIFWDADVIAEPRMITRMVKALEYHPGSSYAYSNFYYGKKKMPARVFDPRALEANNYIHSTSLIRREAVVLWDEDLKRFQDWDLWLTLLEQGSVGCWVPEYLFRVIPHVGGISRWLPQFAFRSPWRSLPFIRPRVMSYEHARHIVLAKHHLAGVRQDKQ